MEMMTDQQPEAPARQSGAAFITWLLLGLCLADLIAIYSVELGAAIWTMGVAGVGLGIGALVVEIGRKSGTGLGLSIAGLSFAVLFFIFLAIWGIMAAFFDDFQFWFH